MGTLVIVVVLFFVLGGALLAGAIGFGLFAYGEKARARAEKNAPTILDAAFDGRADVVFKVNLESPSFETVVLGAKERGYTLTSQTDDTPTGSAKTLIFEKSLPQG